MTEKLDLDALEQHARAITTAPHREAIPRTYVQSQHDVIGLVARIRELKAEAAAATRENAGLHQMLAAERARADNAVAVSNAVQDKLAAWNKRAQPEGYVLVPYEPTDSMRLAPANDRPGFSRNVATEIWKSMVLASPLGAEFEKVLYGNLSSLYVEDAAPQAKEGE